MENSKFAQIEDVRQSKEWEEFLSKIGWKCDRTKDGNLISFNATIFGTLGKVQRPQDLTTKKIKEIDEICKKNKCLALKLEPKITQNLRVLEDSGFIKSYRPLLPPSTIIIDLEQSESDLWKDLSRNGRYSVNRAKRDKTKIEYYHNPSKRILNRFLKLTKQTQTDRRYVAASQSDLEFKISAFQNNVYIIFAKNSAGKDMVGNMYLTYKDSVWYLHGGTSTKGRKIKAGYELVWQSILFFKDKGFKFLDFDGVDDERFPSLTKSWERFSHFKEKFSPNRVVFPMPYIKVYSPILRLFIKILGKTPL